MPACCTGPCPKRLAFHANAVSRCCARLAADKRALPSQRALASAMQSFATVIADCDTARQQKMSETSDRADALLALANAQIADVDGRMKLLADSIDGLRLQLKIATDDNARKRDAIVTLVELARSEISGAQKDWVAGGPGAMLAVAS